MKDNNEGTKKKDPLKDLEEGLLKVMEDYKEDLHPAAMVTLLILLGIPLDSHCDPTQEEACSVEMKAVEDGLKLNTDSDNG